MPLQFKKIKKILSHYGINDINIKTTKEKNIHAKISFKLIPNIWSLKAEKLYINPNLKEKQIRIALSHEIGHYLTEKEFVSTILKKYKPKNSRELHFLRERKNYQPHGKKWKQKYRILRKTIKVIK